MELKPNNPIKALHVLGQLEYGGVTTWIKTIIDTNTSNDLQIDICCNFRKNIGPLADVFEKIGCTIYHVPLSYHLWDYIGRLKKILASGNYNIIHDHRSFQSGASLKAAALARIPVRIAYHHTPNDLLVRGPIRDSYNYILKRWMFKYATHIWGCSQTALSGHYGISWKSKDPRIDTLYGAVRFTKGTDDARERIRNELGIQSSDKIIGFIGRITYQKNPIVGIKACIEVLKKRSDTHALFVGEGPYLADLKDIASQSETKNRIHFFGFRRDIPDILEAIDIFFQPSHFEGFPLATLEALNSGISFVGSNTAGLLEALPEDMHHFCSEPNNLTGHINNIITILNSLPCRTRPIAFLEKYTAKAFYSRIIDNYRKALCLT